MDKPFNTRATLGTSASCIYTYINYSTILLRRSRYKAAKAAPCLTMLTSCLPLQIRSETIATYALCGFANIASVGIQIGGISAIAPSRASDLAKIAFRALASGTIACFLTACIAGEFCWILIRSVQVEQNLDLLSRDPSVAKCRRAGSRNIYVTHFETGLDCWDGRWSHQTHPNCKRPPHFNRRKGLL